MFPHRFPVRVYFEDTDAGGIVYHARYLHFAERARTEAMRAAGLPHARMRDEFGAMFVVSRVEIAYWRPALLDDALTVLSESVSSRGASVRLRQTVLRQSAEGGAERIACVAPLLVCVGRGSLRPVPIPPPWRAALAAGATEEER